MASTEQSSSASASKAATAVAEAHQIIAALSAAPAAATINLGDVQAFEDAFAEAPDSSKVQNLDSGASS